MTFPHEEQSVQDNRLLDMLQRLLGIRAIELRPVFDEAATIIAEAFRASKVDIFVYRPARTSLVALGTSRTRMGQRRQALGLDVLPLANGGRAGWVFRTGTYAAYQRP